MGRLDALGTNHPVVRLRDYYSLWVFRVKEARGQVSLIYRTAIITGGAVVVLRDTPYAALWWVAPILVGLLGILVSWLNDRAKVPNAENRVKQTRANNYVSPSMAIRLIVQARQIDAALETDGKMEEVTRTALSEHARGIDMDRFDGDGSG